MDPTKAADSGNADCPAQAEDDDNLQAAAEWEAHGKYEKAERDLGQRVVSRVEAALASPARKSRAPSRYDRPATEEERVTLAEVAKAARERHARVHYASPDELEGATLEQCEAEYGRIMGFPYRPESADALKCIAEVTDPREKDAREVYSELRKAITRARKLARQLPDGGVGPAGYALLFMRGILPELPKLTEPPFDRRPPQTDRAAFVREREGLLRSIYETPPTSRDLAVLCLLHGFCPDDSYEMLLKRASEPSGLTVAQVIDRETKCVEKTRGAPEVPT